MRLQDAIEGEGASQLGPRSRSKQRVLTAQHSPTGNIGNGYFTYLLFNAVNKKKNIVQSNHIS